MHIWDYGAQVVIGGEGSTLSACLDYMADLDGKFIAVEEVVGKTGIGLRADRVFHPYTEGHDHYNVYSGSSVELCRWLSNFAPVDLHIDADAGLPWGISGYFGSIEAVWYYARCRAYGLQPEKLDHLRPLHGFAAKQQGRKLVAFMADYPRKGSDEEMHRQVIEHALLIKREKAGLMEALIALPDLPFVHYYAPRNSKVVIDAPEDWTHRLWFKWMVEAKRSVGIEVKSKCWARKAKNQRLLAR